MLFYRRWISWEKGENITQPSGMSATICSVVWVSVMCHEYWAVGLIWICLLAWCVPTTMHRYIVWMCTPQRLPPPLPSPQRKKMRERNNKLYVYVRRRNGQSVWWIIICLRPARENLTSAYNIYIFTLRLVRTLFILLLLAMYILYEIYFSFSEGNRLNALRHCEPSNNNNNKEKEERWRRRRNHRRSSREAMKHTRTNKWMNEYEQPTNAHDNNRNEIKILYIVCKTA